jgi:crotonobetainyl-CoA:carnitine CoA-transferase CaiB-like acyl-CoA transferase
MNADHPIAHELFAEIWRGLGGDEVWLDRVRFHGDGALPSPFAVTDFAAATIAAAGAAVGELLEASGAEPSVIDVDRVLSSGWFHIFPMPPSRTLPGYQQREPVSKTSPWMSGKLSPWLTEFETADSRWLRIQATFPSMTKQLTKTLGTREDVSEVAAAIGKYPGEEIEQQLVDARVTVALSRTIDEWLTHPAGRAAHAEPIVHVQASAADGSSWEPAPGRPLAGIKVLDCTRVVAGPTATRFLAACGAEVLRIDAPGSDETSGTEGRVPNDLMLGKRWAFLDLKRPQGRARFLELLSEADVFVHTYRPEGIDELVSPAERQQANPDLVEVALRAYGWTGPWALRRGFDTITQFSTGIAAATQAWALEKPETRVPLVALGRLVDASRPRHMPVEALDLGSGYEIAAAAIRGLTRRLTTGEGSVSHLSLARTAAILTGKGEVPEQDPAIKLLDGENLDGPWEDRVYSSGLGPVKRLRFPLAIERNPLFWEHPADRAGASDPVWVTL